MKVVKALAVGTAAAAAAVAALGAVYWFNLDNKLIFYVVRPGLNWLYDHQKRDVRF